MNNLHKQEGGAGGSGVRGDSDGGRGGGVSERLRVLIHHSTGGGVGGDCRGRVGLVSQVVKQPEDIGEEVMPLMDVSEDELSMDEMSLGEMSPVYDVALDNAPSDTSFKEGSVGEMSPLRQDEIEGSVGEMSPMRPDEIERAEEIEREQVDMELVEGVLASWHRRLAEMEVEEVVREGAVEEREVWPRGWLIKPRYDDRQGPDGGKVVEPVAVCDGGKVLVVAEPPEVGDVEGVAGGLARVVGPVRGVVVNVDAGDYCMERSVVEALEAVEAKRLGTVFGPSGVEVELATGGLARVAPVSGMVEDMLEIVATVGDVVDELVAGVSDGVVVEVAKITEGQEEEEEEEVDVSQWLDAVTVELICNTWREGNVVRPVSDEQEAVLKRIREVYGGTEVKHIPSLKNKDRRLVNEGVALINGLLHNVKTKDITEVNRLMYAGAFVIAERLGMIKSRKGGPRKAQKEPWWKRRIQKSIKQWRKDLGLVDAFKRGNLKNAKEKARLVEDYRIVEKGTVYVTDFLKGKIHAGSCKVRNHLKRNRQQHQNTLFKNDQKQLYKELDGSVQADSVAPNKKEATDFWSGIWSNPVTHNRNAEWIKETRRRNRRVERQEDVVIGIGEVKAGIRRMTNWKAPGPDGVQGFWFKKFTSVHATIADGLRDCLARGEVPEWMTVGRTSLFMKDPAKGPVADNYRPIACLPMMWKLLTGILSEKIYDHLDGNNLLPDEQKGCRKQSRGTKDQLLIDKMIMKDAKQGRKNLSMGWIDYKKAYDMVPHSWLLEVVDLMGVAGNVASLLASSMMGWKTQLIGGGDVLGTVDIKRGIFQGDSLSPLLFVMVMIPLSQRLNAMNEGYKLVNEGRSINHLLFMDDLKLYARSDSQLEKLVGVVKSYSDDIMMEFGLSKCAVLSVVKGKQIRKEGLVLPSGDLMKEVDEEGYKYLGVLQKDGHLDTEMKTKVEDEYFRRLGLLLESELYAGNLIAGINSWAIGIVRYTAGVLSWGDTKLKEIEKKTRRKFTLHGAFHRNSDIDRLYLKRKDL